MCGGLAATMHCRIVAASHPATWLAAPLRLPLSPPQIAAINGSNCCNYWFKLLKLLQFAATVTHAVTAANPDSDANFGTWYSRDTAHKTAVSQAVFKFVERLKRVRPPRLLSGPYIIVVPVVPKLG